MKTDQNQLLHYTALKTFIMPGMKMYTALGYMTL